MTLLRSLCLTIGIAFVAGSCWMPDGDIDDAETHIVGIWELVSVGTSDGPVVLDAQLSTASIEGVPAWLEFHADGSVTGEGPCNDIDGRYAVERGRVILADVVMSAAECLDATGGDAMMRAETMIVEPLLGPSVELVISYDTDETLQLATHEVTWGFHRHQG